MDKHNEWISISDLMSGAVAVIAVLFAVSILLAQEKIKNPETQIQRELDSLLRNFGNQVKGNKEIIVDIQKKKICLSGEGFESGVSCLTNNISLQLNSFSDKLKHFLIKYPQLVITIEGHSDTTSITNTITDFCKCKNSCKDNVSLSLARALSARDELTIMWESDLREKVMCTGFGFNRYNYNKSPSENRRVEISFTITTIKSNVPIKKR